MSTTHDPNLEQTTANDAIIGAAFKWSLVVIVLVGLIIAAVIVFQSEGEEVTDPIDRDPVVGPEELVTPENVDPPQVTFTDITSGAGIDFVHQSGATGEKLLPETMGGGVAFLDYDNDGDQDLMFVDGAPWPHDVEAGAVPGGPAVRLYANDGTGQFTDVTTEAGFTESFYGMGIACGDYDHDNDTDVYITALSRNRMYQNQGDGTFVDVTTETEASGSPSDWSSSAGFFDWDGDGDLDLFICNYVKWTREIDKQLNFTLDGVNRAYGPPTNYRGTHCTLLHNNGNGTFSDLSFAAGIDVVNPATDQPMGKALAVTFADIDQNGLPDILVANDTVDNFVFRAQTPDETEPHPTYREVGTETSIARDSRGEATGAMGMDAAVFNNDNRLGVAIANFANEQSALYVQDGEDPWFFSDMSAAEGLGSPSRLKLSFGLFFFDYDLDGRLDLLQANGHLEDEINTVQPSQHYEQAPQLFWNAGSDAQRCFAVIDDSAVGDLGRHIVGRGAAYADIDGDGDLDVILTQIGRAPLLLRNDQALDHNWLRVKLTGTDTNTEGIGAWVELKTDDGGVQRRQVMPTRSYLSQVELPVTFGLGPDGKPVSVTVYWSNGREQTVDVQGQVNTMIEITEAG